MKSEKFETIKNPIEEAKRKIIDLETYRDMRSHTPYIFELKNKNKEIHYFGSHHTHNPDDPVFRDIETMFLESPPDIVFVEGVNFLHDPKKKEKAISWLKKTNRKEVIEKSGEPGFALKLAVENSIEFESPEPPLENEISHLLGKGFSKEDIFTFYFFRHVLAFKDHTRYRLFEDYIKPRLLDFKQATQWKDFDYSFEKAEEMSKKIWGEFNIENPLFYKEKVDPVQYKKDEGTIINEISKQSINFRDAHIVEKIAKGLEKHDNVFVVYGAAHAVRQKPALKSLLS